MEKTKHKGVYSHTDARGNKTYYMRKRIQKGAKRSRSWVKIADTLDSAAKVKRGYDMAVARENLGMTGQLQEKRVTVPDMMDKYIEDFRRRRRQEKWDKDAIERNTANKMSSVRRIAQTFPDTCVHMLTAEMIAESDLLPQDLTKLRAALMLAEKWGYIPRGQVPRIDVPKLCGRGRALSLQELQIILPQVSEEHRDLILLTLFTTMRTGDFYKITPDVVDYENGVVRIYRRKNGEPKIFEIIKPTASILRRRLLANGGRVFATNYESLSSKIYRERKSVKGIKLHWTLTSVRHTAMTWAKRGGIDLDTIREVAGHKSSRMTEHYIHDTSRIEQRKALELVAGILGNIAV